MINLKKVLKFLVYKNNLNNNRINKIHKATQEIN